MLFPDLFPPITILDNSLSLKVYVGVNLSEEKQQILKSREKGNKTLEHKTIANDLFKQFLIDVWSDVGKAILLTNDLLRSRVDLAYNPNLDLEGLLATFQLSFLEKTSLPHVFSKIRSDTKNFEDRFGIFFPINQKTDGAEGGIRKKKYYLRWVELKETLEQNHILKIFNEVGYMFRKLEWLPNNLGVKSFWRKKGNHYSLISTGQFYVSDPNQRHFKKRKVTAEANQK